MASLIEFTHAQLPAHAPDLLVVLLLVGNAAIIIDGQFAAWLDESHKPHTDKFIMKWTKLGLVPTEIVGHDPDQLLIAYLPMQLDTGR